MAEPKKQPDKTLKVITSIEPIKVHFLLYTFTSLQTRAFYGNALLFQNLGNGNVFINDVWLIPSGGSLSLSSNQNEVDYTMYKMSFDLSATTFRLQVAVKENQGVSAAIQAMLNDPRLTAGDRRKFLKEYQKAMNKKVRFGGRRRGGNF